MFDSIYSASVTPGQFFAMALASLLSGVIFSWLMSFRVRANKRFFIVSSIIPFAALNREHIIIVEAVNITLIIKKI